MHKHLPMPYPSADTWDWQLQGACRGHDSAVFFHPDGERGHAREDRERNAKSVCASCPVLQQCREHSLAVHEPYGIWGGMTETERAEYVRSLRKRGARVRAVAEAS